MVRERIGEAIEVKHSAVTREKISATRRRRLDDGQITLIPVMERFEAKFIPEPMSGCWIWIGAGEFSGYGRFGMRDRLVGAHRASWELYRGSIPSGMQVLHRCDNPTCVNPDHLMVGTPQENMDDKRAKGRQPIGSQFSHSKLSEGNVIDIRNDTRSLVEVAATYGVSISQISNVRRGKQWRHVR